MALSDWLKYFPDLKEKKNVHCPFHADKTPSLSIDLKRNLAHCFGCGWGGTFDQFESDVEGFDVISLIEARKAKVEEEREEGEEKKIAPFLPLADVEKYHGNLLLSERHLLLLKEKRLLDMSTIERFKLGLEGNRIIIPIFDAEGRIINLRKYSFSSKPKCISVEGYGRTRIFSIENLNEEHILFLAGEMDCLLGNQLGYHAVTLTTGEATRIPAEYLPMLRGKIISICYDLDKSGIDGALKLKASLLLFAKEVRIIELPKDLGKGGDFTDFFLQGHPKEQFDALLEEVVEEIEIEDLSLSRFWNRKVAVTAKISGKNMVPFLVPKKIRMSCKRSEGTKMACAVCNLGAGDFDLEFYPSNPIYLELIESPKTTVEGIIRKQITHPKKCFVKIEYLEYQNVESLRLLPADLFSTSGEYITHQVYFIGSGVRSNTICRLQGIVVPEPKLQYATLLIEKAEQEAGVLNLFHRSKPLEIFRSDDVSGKLMQIYRDFESNVTFIFGRSEIMQVLDFVFFSPITFRFAGRFVPKGWVEALIIGDSRQGKSETARAIVRHYGIGCYCGSESATIAGLKGGVAQIGRQWQLQWGIIPLNHKGIVVIDDFQKMDKRVLPALSRIRSEGVAEIIKIESQSSLAQTRLVWISNPMGDRTLSSYSFGIEAVPDLVEQPSDIARFDLVVFAQEGEVDMTQIPMYLQEKQEHVFTSDLCRELLLWAWTRSPEQIVFDPEAEQLIFQVSTEILEKYRSPIAVVKSGEQHIVIAKLAVAIAARLFSTDETEEKIIVRPRHVQYVRQFLFDIWDSASCLYNEFAMLKRQENRIEDQEEVRETIGESHRGNLADDLLRYPQFLLSDFEDLLASDRSTAKLFVSKLIRNRALVRKRGFYEKTPAFIQLLRELRQTTGADPPF